MILKSSSFMLTIFPYIGRKITVGTKWLCSLRHLSLTGAKSEKERLLRNMGIMAHIDAGKTTTTERFLFYSGATKMIGEVHEGDTTTDYMAQERARGITITSAAVTFPWNGFSINLIDTPGHVDFTMEVERSLLVLDGAVAVFDASAGVQAQSFTVWQQADRYEVPRICYLNKMDKHNANYEMSIRSIREKLGANTLLMQKPLLDEESSFKGVVDLLKLKKIEWKKSQKIGGEHSISLLNNESDPELFEECNDLRRNLVEQIADLDDTVAESLLQNSDYNVSGDVLQLAVRRIVLDRLGYPIFFGSSYKNIGVQPLLDAVVKYLPSPLDRSYTAVNLYSPNLCALVFKIIHDQQRGELTFVRVYSGELKAGQSVYNANQSQAERISHLYTAFADEFKEVRSASMGSIVLVSGLKNSITGDMLVTSKSAFEKAEERLKEGGLEADDKSLLVGVNIPEPVYMCSIEASSLMHQKKLDYALACLSKEDPSFKVKTDDDTGQTVLSGMGELHLEIIIDRIRKEYKVEAELGPIQISYRETIDQEVENYLHFAKNVGDRTHDVKVSLVLEPCPGYKFKYIEMLFTKDNQNILKSIWRSHLTAIDRGIVSGFQVGPLLSFPVVNVRPRLKWFEVGRKTSDTMISAAVAQCMREALQKTGVHLLEPVMKLEIAVEGKYGSAILGDLAKRRADIQDITARKNVKIISAVCPLSELKGFSGAMRYLSSGLANISMEFAYYRRMSQVEYESLVDSFGGIC